MRELEVDVENRTIIVELYNGIDNEKNIKSFIRNNISQHPDRLGYRFNFIIKLSENKEFYCSSTVLDLENIKLSWGGVNEG